MVFVNCFSMVDWNPFFPDKMNRTVRMNSNKIPQQTVSAVRRGVIPLYTSIDQRPTIVNARCYFGDWEGDTVISKWYHVARSPWLSANLATLPSRVDTRKRSIQFIPPSPKARTTQGPGPNDHLLTMAAKSPIMRLWQLTDLFRSSLCFLGARIKWEHQRDPCADISRSSRTRLPSPTMKSILVTDKPSPQRKTLSFRIFHGVFFKTKSSLTVALQSWICAGSEKEPIQKILLRYQKTTKTQELTRPKKRAALFLHENAIYGS